MLQQAKAQRATIPRAPRPAVPMAGLFLLGVLGHDRPPLAPGWELACLSAVVAIGWMTLRRKWMCSICIAAALLMAGAVAGQLEKSFYRPDEIGLFCSTDRQLAQLELTLDDPPRQTRSVSRQRPMPPRQMTRGTVRRIWTTRGWQEASGTVLLYIEPPDERLIGGETIQAMGWLERLSPPMNPGQFDFAEYYRRERLLATFSICRTENLHILAGPPRFDPVAFIRSKSRSLLNAGFTKSNAIDHALLRALLLGDKDPLLRDVQDLFIRTGTSHHLSISGLHVAVLAACVYFLCRASRWPPRTTAVVTLTFVLIYAIAALPNPPVIRSVLLCAFLLLGTLARRVGDPIQLLALSVFGMLLYSPLDIYDVGFELSFGTVLGLMLFTKPLDAALFPVDPDMALAPKPKRKRSWIARGGIWFRRWLREACVAAIVAWFVSLPMILHHFDRLNPWATLASVVLAPIVFLGLIGGMLKIVLTLLCPPLAWAWAYMAAAPICLMRHCLDWLARLPGSDVTLRPIPVPVMLLYYATLLATLLPGLSRRMRRSLTISAGTTILLLPIGLTLWARHHPSETRITILSVGAGSCAVVETDDGQTLLIDAGSSGSSDLYRGVIEPYFRTRGLRRADAVFVSHADFDHYGAMADVGRGVGIGKAYFTPQFSHNAEESHAAQALLQTLKELHCPTETLSVGRSIRLTPDTMLDILWPPADAELSTNDSSMVLRLTIAGRTVLFPGDVQSAAMEALLADEHSLHADVLIAPHHGSLEDTTPAFVDAVAPAYIISSDDRTPSQKQRAFDRQITTPPILHTHLRGAVTITIRHDGTMDVQPFLEDAAK